MNISWVHFLFFKKSMEFDNSSPELTPHAKIVLGKRKYKISFEKKWSLAFDVFFLAKHWVKLVNTTIYLTNISLTMVNHVILEDKWVKDWNYVFLLHSYGDLCSLFYKHLFSYLSSMHKILNKFLTIFEFYSLVHSMESSTLYNKLHFNQVKVS